MKRLLSLLLISLLAASCPCPVHADGGGGDDFASSALGKEVIDLGMKFLDNPGDFFFNLHSDNEDFSPVPASRHGAVRFNFFPTSFPLTWVNLNMKVKVLNEHGAWPQIDLVGMYGDIAGLHALNLDTKPTFTDYSAGAVFTKAADAKTRLFGGVKYSVVNMDIAFSTPVVVGDFKMTNLDFKVADTFLFTGITHQTTPDRGVTAQIGYGFTYHKIVSRLMLDYRHLELGMDIYPEGLFVVHPFMAWHWYF